MPVDPETGEPAGKLQQIDYSPPGQNRSPVWSPDGKKLAVIREVKGKPTELCIVSSEGGILKAVALKDTPRGRFFYKDWSPDGKRIAFDVRMQKTTLFLMKNVIPENQR